MADSRAKRQRILACDGLRAIALLGVTAFHIWPHHVPGGYFGVNIFFVLAGFFVSQKIYNSLVRGQRFNLMDFYRSRFRRLYAPLLPLLIGVNLWTYLLQPNVYKNVRESTPSVLLFFNNVYQLLGNRSYFATHGNFQPFTHMWTLALEVQFYLLYPLLVLLLWRVFGQQWHKTSAALFGLSLLSGAVMSVRYQVGIDPTPIYYSFLCRLFAFTLGGAAAFGYLPVASNNRLLHLPRPLRNLIAGACLFIIIATFFVADYQHPFVYRGGMLLYSLVAVGCILLVYPGDLGVARLLSLRGLQALSRRSYSYYIWQYCLLVLGTSWHAFSTTLIAIRNLQHFGLLLMLGEISYRFFEQRVISFTNRRYQRLLVSSSLLLLVFMQLNLQPMMAQTPLSPLPISTPTPTPPPVQEPAAPDDNSLSEEVLAELQQLRLLAIGDSVLDMVADLFQHYLPQSTVDAKISRQIWQGVEVLADLQEAGKNADVILISLGTNGDFKESVLEKYNQLAGDTPLIFLTTVMPDSWEQSVNKKLRNYADIHAGVYIADWYTLAKTHPEWFYDDGTHPKPEGAQQLVELILQQLAKLA